MNPDPSPYGAPDNLIRQSAPFKIGTQEWRLTVSRTTHGDTYVGDEWRRAHQVHFHKDSWHPSEHWGRDDFHNGATGGLPKSLRKFYAACPWAHHIGGDNPPHACSSIPSPIKDIIAHGSHHPGNRKRRLQWTNS